MFSVPLSFMEPFLFLILLPSIFLVVEASDPNYPPANCGDGAPDIHFPFRLKGHHPNHCGHPDFELFCKGNTAMIHFPCYGDLVIKSISYDTKELDLLDPKRCVHQVFLNLNLSPTPFQYHYLVKNYTYLNCSAPLPPPLQPVPCLSGSHYNVYTVESSLAPPRSCVPVKTVAIPFPYSPYLSDNSFGLRLTWNLPGPKGGQNDKGFSAAHQAVVVIAGVFAFTMAILISIHVRSSKIADDEKRKESLGEYEILRTS